MPINLNDEHIDFGYDRGQIYFHDADSQLLIGHALSCVKLQCQWLLKVEGTFTKGLTPEERAYLEQIINGGNS